MVSVCILYNYCYEGRTISYMDTTYQIYILIKFINLELITFLNLNLNLIYPIYIICYKISLLIIPISLHSIIIKL